MTWTLVIGFLSITAAMHAYQVRTINARIDALRGELTAEFEKRFGELRADFARMDQRIAHLEAQ